MIITGASAYARTIDFKSSEICDEVGAYLMVDMAHMQVLLQVVCIQCSIPLRVTATYMTTSWTKRRYDFRFNLRKRE